MVCSEEGEELVSREVWCSKEGNEKANLVRVGEPERRGAKVKIEQVEGK